MPDLTPSQAAAILGRLGDRKLKALGGAIGGRAKSPAKTKAAKRNGAKPCAPGKRRGRKPKPVSVAPAPPSRYPII